MNNNKFSSFKEFYPYYLSEHKNATSRRLHFIGTALVLILLIIGIFTGKYVLLIIIPLCGYGFAWFGHFFFEKNKPATFKYPLYSLGSDFVMFWDMLTGQLDRKMKNSENPKDPTQ